MANLFHLLLYFFLFGCIVLFFFCFLFVLNINNNKSALFGCPGFGFDRFTEQANAYFNFRFSIFRITQRYFVIL